MVILRLAVSNFCVRGTRFSLAIAAVALAVALVVSITTGYASNENAIRRFVVQFVGSIDIEITHAGDDPSPISQQLLDELRADPRIQSAHGRLEARSTPLNDSGAPISGSSVNLFGVDVAFDPIVSLTPIRDGRWFDDGEQNVVVIDQNTQEAAGAKIGDMLRLPGSAGTLELKIIGVVQKPGILKEFFRSGYVPLATMQRFVGRGTASVGLSKIRGEFKPEVANSGFLRDWIDRLSKIDPQLRVRQTREDRKKLDQNLAGMKLASYLGGCMAMLAAIFIVFGTLSMGVVERQRQLAVLRAIGATRSQIGRLVIFEGVVVAVLGAAIGVPLGFAFVHGLAWLFPVFFSEGISFDLLGAIFATAVASLAVLVASILPAWKASGTRPLDAMQVAARVSQPRLPWRTFVAGLVLMSIDSLLIFSPLPISEFQREVRLYGHLVLGLPTLMIGAALIAPMIVVVVEALLGRLVAMIAGVRFELLSQQLSGALARAAGTAAALMVGLAALITMYTQGTSALQSWSLPTRFPDIFIFAEAGLGTLGPAEVERVRAAEGIEPESVMPIVATDPRLGDNIFAVAGAFSMPNRTMFLGIDPKLAFDMMQLDFRAGDETTAKRMLIAGQQITLRSQAVVHGTIELQSDESVTVHKLDGSRAVLARADIASIEPGRYLVVTNEFKKLRGLTVGNDFPLESGFVLTRRINYTIVGVVWSPGIDVMLNAADLPNRVQEQTAGLVFGTLKNAADDFKATDARVLAAKLKPAVDRLALTENLKITLGRTGMNVADVRQLKHGIETMFTNMLRLASTVAWAAMVVASLGVANTLVAGIRTRQHQIGVLRAVGLTRSELLRQIMAEGILLAACGALLGAVVGILLATNANQLYAVAIGFDPPLVIPWGVVGAGVGVVMGLGVLASLWPAVSASRRDVLDLLQAGRSAA